MPNHIKQTLLIEGKKDRVKECFNSISGKWDDGTHRPINFEKIIPSPEIYKEIGEVYSHIVDLAKKMTQSPLNSHPLVASLEKQVRAELELQPRYPEDIDKVLLCIKAYWLHGCFYWYDWNLQNWGTKWNAYGQEIISENKIQFETAWSCSEKVIDSLAEKFPELKMTLTYADEDAGSNCGVIQWQGKMRSENIPSSRSQEAFEIYFSLNPDSREDFEIKDGVYQYKEEFL